MATLDDILTAQKNGVIAINNLNQTWLSYSRRNQGQFTTAVISGASPVLIYNGPGYLVSVSVVVAGTTNGTAYNFASATSPAASSALMKIGNTVGIYTAGFQFSSGLVIEPGTGQSIVVTYSVD